MKKIPDFKDIRRDMEEGRLTKDGYLGNDTRSIEEIIKCDERTLESLNTTSLEVGKRMRQLTLKGMEAIEDSIELDGFEIKCIEYMGFIPCPFKDNKKSGKRITNVINLKTGDTFSWTDMSIHLIKDHGFFQGKGATFRIEPEDIVEFLGLSK